MAPPFPNARSAGSGPAMGGRRTFLRRLAWGASGAVLAPALLQACGRGPQGNAGKGGGDGGGELVISTFPLYIDPGQPGAPGSVERFRSDTGIQLRYVEDINDVRQFFARMSAYWGARGKMMFKLGKEADAQNVWAYIASLSPAPAAP